MIFLAITLNSDLIILAIISLNAIWYFPWQVQIQTSSNFQSVIWPGKKTLFFPSQSTTPNQCRCPYRTLSIEKKKRTEISIRKGHQKKIWSRSSVYKQENRGPERLSDLPKVTQLSGRSGSESGSSPCWCIVLSAMPHHSPGFRFGSAHSQMLKRGRVCTESVPLFSNCFPPQNLKFSNYFANWDFHLAQTWGSFGSSKCSSSQ